LEGRSPGGWSVERVKGGGGVSLTPTNSQDGTQSFNTGKKKKIKPQFRERENEEGTKRVKRSKRLAGD